MRWDNEVSDVQSTTVILSVGDQIIQELSVPYIRVQDKYVSTFVDFPNRRMCLLQEFVTKWNVGFSQNASMCLPARILDKLLEGN